MIIKSVQTKIYKYKTIKLITLSHLRKVLDSIKFGNFSDYFQKTCKSCDEKLLCLKLKMIYNLIMQ